MQPNTDLVPQLTAKNWEPLARIKTRTAAEIKTSPWSIGLETIDRDYVDFAKVVDHLGDLGATEARVQAGWAKCEPVPGGHYRWDWLDEIVDGCLARGVRPWLETSYGNPHYPGGGGIGLNEGIPSSTEALAGWDRWVEALVRRYGDRVHAWEIWNEPEGTIDALPYAAFFIRSAERIRSVQAAARIIGLVVHRTGPDTWPRTVLEEIARQGKTKLLDELCFHFYPHNPDGAFGLVENLERLCARYAPHVTLRQGETGAPSECIRFMAMGDQLWNERKQAAWNLRRLLAHHARGIPMNLFQLADMHYEKRDGAKYAGRNPKGQVLIAPDKSVVYRKPSYFAAQHVFSVFDGAYANEKRERLSGRFPAETAAYAWRRKGDESPNLIGWWRADEAPQMWTPDLGTIGLEPVTFKDPVLIDFMSGVVFEAPATIRAGDSNAWNALPCAETPLALAEKATLPLRPL